MSSHQRISQVCSQSDFIRSSVWIVDGNSHRVRYRPFVPHMGLGHVPPEVQLELVRLLELDGLLEREEDGEPGEHAG